METNFRKLWKKARTAKDEKMAVRTMAEILSSKEGRKFIFALEPADAALCIEILDHGMAEHNLRASEKQAFFNTLRRLAGKHVRLPSSLVILDKIDYPRSSQLQTSGGFADIKQGQYRGCTVAVKTLMVTKEDENADSFQTIRKQFCKEVIIWHSLSHPNVLGLVGVLDGFGEHRFAMVSEWMVHGNIMEYIKKNAANRLELLHGAAQGLKYLHDANITHGDLKGANILMTNHTPPQACLADFGFTTIVLDPQNPMSCSVALGGGTTTFMAPEQLAPSKFGLDSKIPTQEADIYAFGLVILQVLTGDYPFQNIKPQELSHHVVSGVRPDKPADAENIGILDPLWELMEKCWRGDKTRRPRIQEVVKRVGDAAANWHAEMPPGGTGQQEDSGIEEDSDGLGRIKVFQPDVNDGDELPVDSSTGSSGPNNISTFWTQQPLAKTSEEHFDFELVFKHLDQNNPSPPTALPRPKLKGLKFYLNKVLSVFGCNSRH